MRRRRKPLEKVDDYLKNEVGRPSSPPFSFSSHRVASSTLSPPFYSVGSKRFRARFFAKRCLYIYIYIQAGKRWPATGWTVIRIGQRQQYPNSKTDGGRLEGTANTRTVAGSMKGTRIAATVIKESDRVNVIHLH